MRLYLMRHAEAHKVEGDIQTDADRTLTDYGQTQAKAVAEELARRQVSAPVLLSSPYLRTKQTAAILAEILTQGAFLPDENLTSTGHAPDLDAIVQRYSIPQHLILVGHQPDLGMLVEKLVGFEFGLNTACLIAFESTPDLKWKHLWNLIPEDLLHK